MRPAFTAKSKRQVTEACTECEAAGHSLAWLRHELDEVDRENQQVLVLGDGSYDTVYMWNHVPAHTTLLARSARNRALFHLPAPGAHRNRKYGERAPTPQEVWQTRRGWQQLALDVRGRIRHLQYQVTGPFVRKGAPDCPLFLLVVRGKNRVRNGRRFKREPLPFLVNAVRDEQGHWVLPLPVATLLFWAWQRWEIEVCHRELKTNFGLGDKQCFNPHATVLSVQWSAWVYALCILAAYRTWGVCGGPPAPYRWWRGAGRWSFNTLWRAYRTALWGQTDFSPLWPFSLANLHEFEVMSQGWRNASLAATHS